MMGSPDIEFELQLERQRDLIREAERARLVFEARSRATTVGRIVRLVGLRGGVGDSASRRAA